MELSFSNSQSVIKFQGRQGFIIFNEATILHGDLNSLVIKLQFQLKSGAIQHQIISLVAWKGPNDGQYTIGFVAPGETEKFTFEIPEKCTEFSIESEGNGKYEFNLEVSSTFEIVKIQEPTNEPDLIVTDEDSKKDYREDDGGLYPYDPTKTDIDIREDPQTIFELMRKYDNGKLIIDPDFQRNLVWKTVQASQFIESVILNFPLPPFYVNQTNDGKYIIVDGLQRTTTLHSFLNNRFQLQGLEALPKLNGKSFNDLKQLEGDYQTKIEDKKLTLYVIKPSVQPKVIYDIFNRINTNGTPLNRQEVRNCIFLGKSTVLLKALSEMEIFRKAIDYGVSPRRMKDRELILRYLAFNILDIEKEYKGDMSDFVEAAMVRINKMSDIEIKTHIDKFFEIMQITYEFFNKYNFRLPTEDRRGSINTAIFESVTNVFAKMDKSFLLKNRSALVNNYKELMSNSEYIDSVKVSTNSISRVKTRFQKSNEILLRNTII